LNRNLRLKRIQIIGKRRGSKELDIIFGRFIDYSLEDLDDSLLQQFEKFLEVNEPDLQSYFFSHISPPKEFEAIFQKILDSLNFKA
tara:strand:+ start:84 stop:341 length:258 start_codon:yes stop_codon:yes gene_type:complete